MAFTKLTKKNNLSFNSLNSEDVFIFEHIYKRMIDQNGQLLDKAIRICHLLEIDPKELWEMYLYIVYEINNSKLSEFKENGRVIEEIA